MSKRKRYSPEYKRELVDLVRRSQSSGRQITLEVGINLGGYTCPARGPAWEGFCS